MLLEKNKSENLRDWIESSFTDENIDKWTNPNLFKTKVFPILTERFPQLEVIKFPPKDGGKYNCFAYVFGFQTHNDFLNKNRYFDAVHILKMINDGALEKISGSNTGDLVLYFDSNDSITHAGILISPTIVISKWSDGPLMKHGLYEVKRSYGDTIQYFQKGLDSDDLYIKYAGTNQR